MNVFELVAKLSLNTSEYEENLDDAKKDGKKEGEGIGDGLGKGIGDGLGKGSAPGISGLLKKIAGISGSVIGLKKVADFALNIGKQAFDQYADYEQLVGGVETLFDRSSNTVIENAKKAYTTAGLSANEYMETVTSFSASLLQSLGGDTEAAARYADMAITDMSDNANKMGSDMESIQNAYQGFAKQNYTMLDNLKLGGRCCLAEYKPCENGENLMKVA